MTAVRSSPRRWTSTATANSTSSSPAGGKRAAGAVGQGRRAALDVAGRAARARPQDRRSTGTASGPPIIIGSAGGGAADGTPLIVVTWAIRAERDGPVRRWLEAVSGRDGKTVWRFELDSKWFDGVEAPYAALWFPGPGVGSGGMFASGQSLYDRDVYRRTDSGPPLAYPAASARIDDKPALICSAGTRLVGLDPHTGSPCGRRTTRLSGPSGRRRSAISTATAATICCWSATSLRSRRRPTPTLRS
jgi:hypothetical protein